MTDGLNLAACADYDAPTQMVKPRERNTRYVDCVQTIPKVRVIPLIP